MSTPEVGVIMLVKPSPNWKAITVACRDRPIRSENGAMMGMVMAALAEPEGIRILMIFWITYMMPMEVISPASFMPCDML